MLKAAAVFTIAAALMLSGVPGAQAVSIVKTDTTWSWDCVPTCGGPNNPSTAVSSIPSPWATPAVGGQWISSVDSGAGGNTSIALDSVIEFSKSIDFGTGSVLNLRVWADDTAGVSLDGGTLTLGPGSAPNFLLDNACAAGPLGCEQTEDGQFTSNSLTGLHTLRIQVHQLRDATPFGTLAEGELSAVPEPTTILLLGSALATAGLVSRRRFRKPGS